MEEMENLQDKEQEPPPDSFSETDNLINQKTFEKRPGTTDKGKDYENLMVAKFILELLKDPEVEDFDIWSNDQQFGDFDDVIIDAKTKNQSEAKYALQLKHFTKKEKQLSIAGLKEEKGNFGLKKYYKSYQSSKNTLSKYSLILLTNLIFIVEENDKFDLKISENETFQVEIIKSEVIRALKCQKKKVECFRFRVIEDESSSSKVAKDYEDFFQNFFLYTNQLNVDELKNDISEEMKKMFSCDNIPEKFLKFVTEWSLLEGTKDKLYKEMLQKLIGLYLVTPYIHPVIFGPVQEKRKVFQNAVSKFQVTIFEELTDEVRRIFGNAKEGVEDKELGMTNRNYQVSDKSDVKKLTDEEITKILWLIGRCPLIVEECPQVYQAIELSNRKFILVGKNINYQLLEKYSVFQKLSDLKNDEAADLSEFRCSLGGNELSLKHLLDEDEEFREVITTNELLMMLDSSYEIKQREEEVPLIIYINRSLSKNVVDLSYLEEIDDETVILIKVITEEDLNILLKFNEFPEKGNIYISRKDCPEEIFKDLGRNWHYFYFHNGHLEWIRSKNMDKIELEKYFLKSYTVKESELWQKNCQNYIHIISDNPGSGKSSFLKNLHNSFSSKSLVMMCSPQDGKEISNFLKNSSQTDLDDFILDLKYPNLKKFDKSVIRLFMKKNEVLYFWNALDEIASENLNVIFEIMKTFFKKKIVQWLTCRPLLRNTLENMFGVPSQKITPLTEEEQIFYIKENLKLSGEENLDEIALKIKNSKIVITYPDLLSIPLHLNIFVELLKKDKEKLNFLETSTSVIDLLQHFIEEKFKFYYKDKVNILETQNRLKHVQNNHIRQYEKPALIVILEKGHLDEMNIDCNEFLEDVKKEGDCFGFVTEITETREGVLIKFVHVAFVEYFAASYFFRKKILSLEDIKFKKENKNVTCLFETLQRKM